MIDAFYLPAGDHRWLATRHTAGPWDAGAQHGGPPCALLGRAIQQCAPRDDMIVARFTCDILGAVPVAEMEVRARLARPGRRVELVQATASVNGQEAARASAWRVLRNDNSGAAPTAPHRAPAPPALPAGESSPVPGTVSAGWLDGYLSAVEWRPASGSFAKPGPGVVWARLRYPLVPGEETSPLQRVLAIADSGSGISSELDQRDWHFINPELTVHLHREPSGEWVCLDAQTAISAGGAGLATTVLSDFGGPFGVGAQSLLVAPRARPGGA